MTELPETDSAGAVHGHTSVLIDELLHLTQPRPGECLLDCTAGRGGHAAAIAERLGTTGGVLLLDRDQVNLEYARARVASTGVGVVQAQQRDFRWVEAAAASFTRPANLLIADLGFSSNQVEDGQRGLSFRTEGPLDMRLDPSGSTTAEELVNELPETELAQTILELGEEPLARRIAQRIIRERQVGPIRTTTQLALIVLRAYGSRAESSRVHPATRTFQAIRIAVNDELGALEGLLQVVERASAVVGRGEASQLLTPGARIGIISFHSLEDRLVKRAFARMIRAGLAREPERGPICASEDEVAKNPRSRSAKLRVVALVGR